MRVPAGRLPEALALFKLESRSVSFESSRGDDVTAEAARAESAEGDAGAARRRARRLLGRAKSAGEVARLTEVRLGWVMGRRQTEVSFGRSIRPARVRVGDPILHPSYSHLLYRASPPLLVPPACRKALASLAAEQASHASRAAALRGAAATASVRLLLRGPPRAHVVVSVVSALRPVLAAADAAVDAAVWLAVCGLPGLLAAAALLAAARRALPWATLARKAKARARRARAALMARLGYAPPPKPQGQGQGQANGTGGGAASPMRMGSPSGYYQGGSYGYPGTRTLPQPRVVPRDVVPRVAVLKR